MRDSWTLTGAEGAVETRSLQSARLTPPDRGHHRIDLDVSMMCSLPLPLSPCLQRRSALGGGIDSGEKSGQRGEEGGAIELE